MTESELVAQVKSVAAELPPHRLLYHLTPAPAQGLGDWERAVSAALRKPIGGPPLSALAKPGSKVVILADDLTRPTPQKEMLPPLLNSLNAAGVADADIAVIIALGTHRYMTEGEIHERFGDEVCSRVPVVNHTWMDEGTFVHLGSTARGTPVSVNRIAHEADLLIGAGSIVPHVYAGWSGGAKILQPGICAPDTTARTHCMAAEGRDLLGIAGRANNPVRREIEDIAAVAGLDFVLNAVLDASAAPVWVGAGDFVRAHRAGVTAAKKVYVREIPEPADVVLVDARPTTVDYWQAVKSLANAFRGIKQGGTAILVAELPDGIAPTHPEFTQHALDPYEAIAEACRAGAISDGIASATMRLHALIMAHCRVICVAPGMSVADKESLGFRHAGTVAEAVEAAMADQKDGARIGVIEHGGDVLPAPPAH